MNDSAPPAVPPRSLWPRVRTFALSGLASALGLGLYLLFSYHVGLGTRSDAFFSVVAISQAVSLVLYAPFESFALRDVHVGRESGRDAGAPLLAALMVLSSVALVAYYGVGERLLGPLFGDAYRVSPTTWARDFRIVGVIVPLSGAITLLQTYCQARGRLEAPKLAVIAGRLAGLVFLQVNAARAADVIAWALVLQHVVAFALSVAAARMPWPGWTPLREGTRDVLRRWARINVWSMILNTYSLLDRVLASHVQPGFLSLFNLLWTGTLSVLEALTSSFIASDANRMFEQQRRQGRISSVRETWAVFHDTRLAAVALTVLTAIGLAGGFALAAWVPDVRVRVASIGVGDAVLLAVTMLVLQLCCTAWKALGAVYGLMDRGVVFVRTIALMYLAWALPRIGLSAGFGAVGFCVGLLLYYVSFVAVLVMGLRGLTRRLTPASAAAGHS